MKWKRNFSVAKLQDLQFCLIGVCTSKVHACESPRPILQRGGCGVQDKSVNTRDLVHLHSVSWFHKLDTIRVVSLTTSTNNFSITLRLLSAEAEKQGIKVKKRFLPLWNKRLKRRIYLNKILCSFVELTMLRWAKLTFLFYELRPDICEDFCEHSCVIILVTTRNSFSIAIQQNTFFQL